MGIQRILAIIIFLGLTLGAAACSMCKITQDGHTYVGNNEDAWGTHSRIWFKPGQETTYGVAYLEHSKETSLQGGMNEAGLVFDVFAVQPIDSDSKRFFKDRPSTIMYIMEHCATVQEVKAYLDLTDSRYSPIAMFWFIDAKGGSLIMEPDTLILGNEPYAALVNCRPSNYPDYGKVPVGRYHKAMEILNQGPQGGPEYCANIMESMSACRGPLGEGTLYSTIYDLESKDIHVYFYHDFSTSVTFSLSDELKKGEHEISLPELFPENKEYMALMNYKTPYNSDFVRIGLIAIVLIIILLSLILMSMSIFRHVKGTLQNAVSTYLMLVLLVSLNALATVHVVILLLREPVFYFGMSGQLANFPFTQVIYSPLIIGVGSIGLLSWLGLVGSRREDPVKVELPFKLNIGILCVLSLLNMYWDLMIP